MVPNQETESVPFVLKVNLDQIEKVFETEWNRFGFGVGVSA